MDIVQNVNMNFEKVDYQFTNFDKKVLSLFIAGFLAEGNLKQILLDYDDIKLDDLLSFVNIQEKNIHKMDEDSYYVFYETNFKLDIISLINDRMSDYKINYVSPAVIVSCLRYVSLSGSNMLDCYWKKYRTNSIDFSSHPFFKSLQSYALMSGSISLIDKSKNGNQHPISILLDGISPEKRKEKLGYLERPTELSNVNFSDEDVWGILDEIQKKFIGQEMAVEGLFYNIVNNQQLADMKQLPDGQRSIIFLDGPTGTGKTAITREITEKLGIPFTSSSVTNYSSTGYVGADITDTLKELLKRSNGDIRKAERGIIVFDEFDKIAYSRSGGLEMKKAVQQQLLDFLGGGKYIIRAGDLIPGAGDVQFDTSRLTFVCLAALTDLRSEKTSKSQAITGFGQKIEQNDNVEYSITPQDLMSIGLERELVGRFNTYLHTNDYSKEALVKILKESTISPLIGFKNWIESKNKKLEIDDDVYDLIAEYAYDLNLGARSLQTVMNNIRTPFIKEVLRGNSQSIKLDSDIVTKINGNTINRRVRS